MMYCLHTANRDIDVSMYPIQQKIAYGIRLGDMIWFINLLRETKDQGYAVI